MDEQAPAEDPLNAVAQADIAYTYERLGALMAKSGNDGDALAYFREAVANNDLSLRLHAVMARGGMAEMQAILGGISAALAESARAKKLLDGIAADSTSGSLSGLNAQAYTRVAVAQAAPGASGRLDAKERREHWRAALADGSHPLPVAQPSGSFIDGVATRSDNGCHASRWRH